MRWVSLHWQHLCNYVGTVFLAGAGIAGPLKQWNSFFGGDFPLWAVLVGGGLVFVGLVGRLAQKPTYVELLDKHGSAVRLSEERAEAISSMLKVLILDFSEKLGVYNRGMRTSIYCHSNSEFVLLSRISSSPELQKSGRSAYREKQGSIWKAWDEGETVITGFPEGRTEWETKLVEEHGFARAEVQGMSMQSRSIVAIRVDKDHGDRAPIGVVVIEALSPKGVNATHLDKIRSLAPWPILVSSMDAASDHFPDVARTLRDPAGAITRRRGDVARPPKRDLVFSQ